MVNEKDAPEVEQHSPVISNVCVRLHTYTLGPVRPPSRSFQSKATGLSSVLILFGVGKEVLDAELASFGTLHGFQRIFRAFTETTPWYGRNQLIPTATSQTIVYPLFFGNGGIEDWSYGLLSSSLRKHLISQCPLQSLQPTDSHLLVDRCVLHVALARGILAQPHISFATSQPGTSRNTLLAVDTRLDPSATVLSVAIALSSLARPSDWTVRIMCSRRNRWECERMIRPICPLATFDDNAPELNVPIEAFDVETSYNTLMKNPATWRALLPAEIELTVQDDGLLIRRGIECLMDHGVVYLGAPWADEAYNAPLKAIVPSLIGNGGLSLRNVRSMIAIAEGVSARDQNRLFHTRIEPIPEDVMYASHVTLQAPLGQIETARSLVCEQVPFAAALGFHKPWPYWPVAKTHEHMEQILTEERTTTASASASASQHLSLLVL